MERNPDWNVFLNIFCNNKTTMISASATNLGATLELITLTKRGKIEEGINLFQLDKASKRVLFNSLLIMIKLIGS